LSTDSDNFWPKQETGPMSDMNEERLRHFSEPRQAYICEFYDKLFAVVTSSSKQKLFRRRH